mgnify:CR=1 FL=1
MYENIPCELVEEIISYVDYKKYHKEYYNSVLNNINEISRMKYNIDNNICPKVAYEKWGIGKERNDFIEGLILDLIE